MTEDVTDPMEAAAFSGLANNLALPCADRLAAALDALAYYERQME